MRKCVCPSHFLTHFPCFDFKSKHIFGILWSWRRLQKYFQLDRMKNKKKAYEEKFYYMSFWTLVIPNICLSIQNLSFQICRPKMSVCSNISDHFTGKNLKLRIKRYGFNPGPTRIASKGRRSRPICETIEIYYPLLYKILERDFVPFHKNLLVEQKMTT